MGLKRTNQPKMLFLYDCSRTEGALDLRQPASSDRRPGCARTAKFLREREVVHFQRFGDALSVVQSNLDAKNYYAWNPAEEKLPGPAAGKAAPVRGEAAYSRGAVAVAVLHGVRTGGSGSASFARPHIERRIPGVVIFCTI